MSLKTLLYPPILDTYIPAFVSEDTAGNTDSAACYIDFTMPSANDADTIQYVQVVVRNQNTNLSSLDPDKFPCEVMVTALRYDSGVNKYFIELKAEHMVGGKFELNTFYKVQMRFVHTDAAAAVTGFPQANAAWLVENLDYFSEWSTVALIKGISEPTMYLYGYNSSGIAVSFGQSNGALMGKLAFANELDTENLYSYTIKIYEGEAKEEIINTGLIYTDSFSDPNLIHYNLNYQLEFNEQYTIVVDYTTTSLYESSAELKFISEPSEGEVEHTTLGVFEEPDDGRFLLKLRRLTNAPLTGAIYIKRTSSKSDFKVWEDWKIIECYEVTELRENFYDYTFESGVWYKYGLQIRNGASGYTEIKYSKTPRMILLEDMFISSQGRQLNIKFNPTITSFKKTLTETKVDTIGSQYPFIKRNAAVNYATFPIGGMISTAIDENEVFITKDEIYGKHKYLYEKYNTENLITEYNDYYLENKFRMEVLEFLNSGETFLFRSTTEGSFLVKILSGITLTPNTVLGRRLWSFTSTAYEIAEMTLDNINEEGIYSQTENRYGEDYEPGTEGGIDPAEIRMIYTSTDSSPDQNVNFDNWTQLRNVVTTTPTQWTGSMQIIYKGEEAIDVTELFAGCVNLTSIDLSEVNSSNVMSTVGMFRDCSSLKTINLTGFAVRSTSDAESMFDGCRQLSNIIGFSDLELGKSKVVNLKYLFRNCSSLQSIDFSDMNIKPSSLAGTFYGCSALEEIIFGETFDTSATTNFAGMCYECYNLKALDLSYFTSTSIIVPGGSVNFIAKCGALADIKIISTDVLFKQDSVSLGLDAVDINSDLKILVPKGLIDTYKAHAVWKNYAAYFIAEAAIINITYETEEDGIQTEEFESYNELATFIAANKTTFINDLKVVYKNDAGQSIDANNLFAYCTATTIDLSEFNTYEFTRFTNMFYDCPNVETIVFGDDCDTSKVTTMQSMFSRCSKLSSIVNLEKFDMSSSNATQMFQYCSSLKVINITGWYHSSGLIVSKMVEGSGIILIRALQNYMLKINSSFGKIGALEVVVPESLVGSYEGDSGKWAEYNIIGFNDFSETTTLALLTLGVLPAETIEEQEQQLQELGVSIDDV